MTNQPVCLKIVDILVKYMIELIRKKAVTEEIDYQFLMDCLAEYKNPRDKITRLMRSGAIVRVKKGLYVFGEAYARQPLSRETLANLIYGPSYISLEYALSFYGMIPERVEVVTSVTSKRNKFFKTPAGSFSYTRIPPQMFNVGMTQIALDETHNILIATKEKALADKVFLTEKLGTVEDMTAYMIEDLRIEPEVLSSFDLKDLKMISEMGNNRNVSLLLKAIRKAVKK